MEESEAQIATALFRKSCEFIAGAPSLDVIPPGNLPEVAFIGRSNVGKSSLVNALTGRKALARTSNTPGRTQQLNFFNLGDTMMLVDLPGYGYAKASKSEVAKWNELIRAYLRGRQPLLRVCVLVDSRHGLKDSDHEMMEILDKHAVSYQLVLTKTDKLKTGQLEQIQTSVEAASKKHPALHPRIVATSSVDRRGIDALQLELCKVVMSWN